MSESADVDSHGWSPTMGSIAFHLVFGAFVGLGTVFAVAFAFAFLEGPDSVLFTPFLGPPIGVAAGLSWWLWRRRRKTSGNGGAFLRVVVASAFGAALVGGIGFAGGFFGPMWLDPNSAQGPLVGILITGPLGLALGAIGGLVRQLWIERRRRATAPAVA